ncbi:hypothetical protein ADUPG1_001336, partial [Aduncisulcus paluster]
NEEWEITMEHEDTEGLRPDIEIKTPTHKWWVDVSITYEDATLFSIEKRFNEKQSKYGPDGAGIIIGHSGIMHKKSMNFLNEIGMSKRKAEQTAFTLGAIKNTFALSSIVVSGCEDEGREDLSASNDGLCASNSPQELSL